MHLMSVNVGEQRTLQRKNRIEQTGIFKFPVETPVRVTKLGIEGDVIVSKKHHGGPDQAVYVYGWTDYEWWSTELRQDLTPGTFGENLTIRELESALFNIGDFLHIGQITLQVTAPRIPCGTFAARMGDSRWVKQFRRAERPGLYCRVAREGFVQRGEAVSVERYSGNTISIMEMYREYYNSNKSEELLQRHLNAPIAIRARTDLEKDLHQLLNRKRGE